MKHPIAVAFALVVASSAAMAQETSWTGWRVGADLGAVRMRSTWSDIDDDWPAYDVRTNKKSGMDYGVSVGYDWQINHAVIGAQFDYLFGSLTKNTRPFEDTPFNIVAQKDKLKSLPMLRGRAGYAFDKVLLFGTVGIAKPSIQHVWTEAGDPPDSWDFKNSKTRMVYGAGAEYRFTENWSAQGEYLMFSNATKTSRNDNGYRMKVKDKLNMFLVGVNYRFGGPKPVVAPPPPPPPPVEEVKPVAPPPPPPPPPPAPEVKPVVVAPPPPPPPQKIVLDQAVLHFANAKNELSPEGVEAIQQVAQELMKYPGEYSLVVSGHTSSTGSKAFNKALSKRRADAVAKVLIDSGIPAASIQTVGVGPDQPIADNATAEGQARNRRVEIEVKVKDATVETRTIQTQTQDTPAPKKKVIKK